MSIFGDPSFGKYQLLKRLAMGGMAELFRAKRLGAAGFERDVVIKRIHPEFSEDDEFVRMFTNEAKLAALLRHPNIVQVLDFDQVNGTYYIAMELIEGADLKRTINLGNKVGSALPYQLALFIGIQIFKGLAHAHEIDHNGERLHIVHRDVSPHNILISKQGEVKLTDFGIARVMQQVGSTASGVLKGKTSYMAPEQTYSSQVDCRADLFAMGIVLWEMLCRGRLFQASNDLLAVNKVRTGEIPLPHVVNPDIPETLSQIIMGTLERSLETRTKDAKTIARELQRFLWLPSAGEELSLYLQHLLLDEAIPDDCEELNHFRPPVDLYSMELDSVPLRSSDTPKPAQAKETKPPTENLDGWKPPSSDQKPPSVLQKTGTAEFGHFDPNVTPEQEKQKGGKPQPSTSQNEDERGDRSNDWMIRTESLPSASSHLGFLETVDAPALQLDEGSISVVSTIQVDPSALLGNLSRLQQVPEKQTNEAPPVQVNGAFSEPLRPSESPKVEASAEPSVLSTVQVNPSILLNQFGVDSPLALTQLDPVDPDDYFDDYGISSEALATPLPAEAISTEATIQVNPTALLGDLSQLKEEPILMPVDVSETETIEPVPQQTSLFLWVGGSLALLFGSLLLWFVLRS